MAVSVRSTKHLLPSLVQGFVISGSGVRRVSQGSICLSCYGFNLPQLLIRAQSFQALPNNPGDEMEQNLLIYSDFFDTQWAQKRR